MEPQIKYAKTADGVSIAYCGMGEGKPLVSMPNPPLSHIQLEWQFPQTRHWYQRLAEKRKLVRYDNRGSGLSERDVAAFSLESHLLDLEAVVDQLGLERFALIGVINSGPAAIAYAARHAERVSHLILWCCFARGIDQLQAPEMPGYFALMDKDWRLLTETLAHSAIGQPGGELASQIAAFLRESTTPLVLQAAWRAALELDVAALLSQVRSPTLVLHRRQLRWLEVNVARGLASAIPDASLVLLEGASGVPALGDSEAVLSAIDEFLGVASPPSPVDSDEPAQTAPSGTAIILFADIVDSTALTERIGDAAFREKARELDITLRATIREKAGTPIEGKLLGDGVLAVFASAAQAIEAALACGRSGDDAGLPLHLGLHAGDVIREENNVYGGAVNIASRISGLSAPGEVLVSDTVRSLARTSAGVSFVDRGEHALKGVGEPVRVWAVLPAVGQASA